MKRSSGILDHAAQTEVRGEWLDFAVALQQLTGEALQHPCQDQVADGQQLIAEPAIRRVGGSRCMATKVVDFAFSPVARTANEGGLTRNGRDRSAGRRVDFWTHVGPRELARCSAAADSCRSLCSGTTTAFFARQGFPVPGPSGAIRTTSAEGVMPDLPIEGDS